MLASDFPGWGLDGEALHDPQTGVSPDRWSITREDLRYFRKAVHSAVDHPSTSGPSAQPMLKRARSSSWNGPFAPAERGEIGPSMYTVVANYVKPVTMQAGRMSWALMCHPQGLKCDLFITHSWSEGAYEFIDKVLASWPLRSRNAWCCIFAMPQNLDIGAIVSDPLSSPFAVALRQASRMMVVPNRSCSLYTRVWCVYEAYLACRWDKVIFTASPSVMPVAKYTVPWLGFLPFAGGTIALPLSSWVFQMPNRLDVFWWSLASTMLAAVVVPSFRVLFWLECLATTLTGLLITLIFAHPCRNSDFCQQPLDLASHAFCGLPTFKLVFGSVLLIVFLITFEFDRLWSKCANLESVKLHTDHPSVVHATASVAEDKARILSSIGEEVPMVDESIRVLRDARVSTHSLRTAAHRGVNVWRAGHHRYSHAWAGVSLWAWLITQRYYLGNYVCTVCSAWSYGTHPHPQCAATAWNDDLAHVQSVLLVIYVFIWLRAEQDQRAFMSSASAKIQSVTYTVLHVYFHAGGMETLDAPVYLVCLAISSGMLTLVLSAVGLDGVAKIPWVGALLAGFLGPACTCQSRAGSCPADGCSGDSESSDEDNCSSEVSYSASRSLPVAAGACEPRSPSIAGGGDSCSEGTDDESSCC